MTLREYLSQHEITYRAFGAALGRDAAEVWRWAHGHRVPSLEVAGQIEAATGGDVTMRDLLPTDPVAAA